MVNHRTTIRFVKWICMYKCAIGNQRPFGGNVINCDAKWFELEKMSEIEVGKKT